MRKFKSLADLYARCRQGDIAAQRVAIGALENLGGEHLATGPGRRWEQCYRGLNRYVLALVGEYGLRESEAERDLLAEINAVREWCSDVSLEGGA